MLYYGKFILLTRDVRYFGLPNNATDCDGHSIFHNLQNNGISVNSGEREARGLPQYFFR